MLEVVVDNARCSRRKVACALDSKDVDKLTLIFVVMATAVSLINLTPTAAKLREEVDIVDIGRHRVVDIIL